MKKCIIKALVTLVMIIGIPISSKIYNKTYPDPSERKDLSVRAIFLD
tara:strand:+ start:378 stop:518 length:141 start_codon:yes stop_codon:yes gene_type:complete